MAYVRTDADALALLPPLAARGDGAPYALGLLRPMMTLQARADALVAATDDPGTATGPLLDWIGQLVGEPRAGLADSEYRRVIAGRRVAIEGGTTAPAIIRGLDALAGRAGSQSIVTAPGRMLLVARLDATPTETYLRRCADVVADLVPAARVWMLAVSWPGVMVWDGSPGWDAGVWAWSFAGGE